MRWLIAIALLLAGLAHLARLALVDPSIDFLRPSLRGDWIVPGYTLIKFKGRPVAHNAVFDKTLVCDTAPRSLTVTVIGCRGFRMDVNQHQRVAVQNGATWKESVRVDLAPYLHAGTNIVRVLVPGTESPPALLVAGPPEIRTGNTWYYTQIGRNGRFPASRALRDEWFMQENRNATNRSPLLKHPLARLWMGLCGLYAAFVVYALVPESWKRWRRKDGSAQPRPPEIAESPSRGSRRIPLPPFLRRHGLCLVILAAVAVVQYRNTAAFPSGGGFDAPGHLEYVRIMAAEARVPLPTRGWQTYQPPAYYTAAGCVYRLFGGSKAEARAMKAVQYFTTTCGLLNLGFTLLLLNLLFPDRLRVRTLGFASVAFMPVHFVTHPMITNEVFVGTTVAGAMLAGCWAATAKGAPWLRLTVAGLACGIAMLSKFTGIFVLFSLTAWLGLRALANGRSVRAWLAPLLFVSLALLVAGWFYWRNVTLYDNAFIGNWDVASTFGYEQPPGYRTLGYYTRFGSIFTLEAGRSMWASFWDGQYGSLWADAHRVILGPGTSRALPATFVLWLGLLPTAAGLLGLAGSIVSLLRRRWDDPRLALALQTFFTLVGMIAFTMELPSYTTIHARFLLSLIAPAAIFAGLGMDRIARQLGGLRWIPYAALTLQALLVLYTYRFGV